MIKTLTANQNPHFKELKHLKGQTQNCSIHIINRMLSPVGVNANIVIIIFIVISLEANRPEREKEGAIKISNGNFKIKFDLLQLAQNYNNGHCFLNVLQLSLNIISSLFKGSLFARHFYNNIIVLYVLLYCYYFILVYVVFLTEKFGWNVEMGRLNLDVKFMVLIISVSVVGKNSSLLFLPFLPCFLASGVLLLWEYFRAMEELYTDKI